tara:strand:+ start:235 stop:546 length:312 start_codon:yes stop_codon:yes gene_type:complete
MTIPIYKKTIFEKMGIEKQTEIANKITIKDRDDITRLMKLFDGNRDARGRWNVPEKYGKQLLIHFQKYVDPKATTRLFGCGGCAQKMVEYMFGIYKIWQNQTK